MKLELSLKKNLNKSMLFCPLLLGHNKTKILSDELKTFVAKILTLIHLIIL